VPDQGESEVEGYRGLVECYRKRAEEIRAIAGGIANSEERVTLLQIADEYERAAIVNEILWQIHPTVH